MTEKEFEEGMVKLQLQFGKAHYGPDRKVRIALVVRDLQPHTWNRIIGRFLDDHRQAPLVPEFREAIQREMNQDYERKKVLAIDDFREKVRSNCSNCQGNGVFLAKRLTVQTGPYAFRCNCSTGRADTRTSIPMWSDHFAKAYEVKTTL